MSGPPPHESLICLLYARRVALNVQPKNNISTYRERAATAAQQVVKFGPWRVVIFYYVFIYDDDGRGNNKCVYWILCVYSYLAPRGAQSERIIKQHVVKQHENIYLYAEKGAGRAHKKL